MTFRPPPEVHVTDLVEWLETAISEAERAAREAKYGGTWIAARHNEMPLVCADVAAVDDGGEFAEYIATDVERSTAVHIALNNPDAVLRRCAADRKILAECVRWIDDGSGITSGAVLGRIVLRALAEGYGYQEVAVHD